MIKIFLTAVAVWEVVKLGCLCASPFVAEAKNRHVVGWFFLTFIFGIIPFIALLAMPKYVSPARLTSRGFPINR